MDFILMELGVSSKGMSDSKNDFVRVDRLVSLRFPELSNRHSDEALTEGLILDFTGNKVKKGLKVPPHTPLDFHKLEEHLEMLKKGNVELNIQVNQETEDFWVVTKPAGIPSHPISLFDTKTITHWALAQKPELSLEFTEVQPTVSPHRLDTDTEGLLIVCKTKKSYEEWRERFKTKQITKRYLAWVQGKLETSKTVELPIAHDTSRRSKMKVVRPDDEKYGPPLLIAHSEIRPIRTIADKDISLVEVTCKTGVTHQVRVHLASIGHPLVGDKLYDLDCEKRRVRAEHHLLLAFELSFDTETYSVEKNHFLKLFK